MSSGDLATIKIIPEVTPGVTPTDDNGWFYVGYLSETLAAEEQFTESGLITPHSQTTGLVKTGRVVNGNIVGELREGEFDVVTAAAFRQADWTADVLKFGQTRRTFTIEQEFTDVDTGRFKQLDGMQVNTMNFNFTRGQIAQLTFGFEGLDGVASDTSLVGLGSVTPISEEPSFETGSGITVLELGGAASGATIRSAVINVAHNLQPIEGIGSDGRDDMAFGAIQVTGNVEFYFGLDAYNEWEKKLAGTETSFKLRTTLPDTAFYEFTVDRLKWGTGGPNSQGRSTQVFANMQFTGLYDGTELTSLQMLRGAGT